MEAVLAGMIGSFLFWLTFFTFSGLSLLFFFIIYTFEIQIEKYKKSNEKETSEGPDSIMVEIKPKKKKIRTFDDEKWEAVTKELERRKNLLPSDDKSKCIPKDEP